MKNAKVYTQDQVVEALGLFKAAALKATGAAGERARFKEFKIVHGLKLVFEGALKMFEDGDFEGSMAELEKADAWLANAQRSYCLNSLERFFDPKIATIRADEDLMALIQKKREAFVEIVVMLKSSFNVDIEEASKRYWELYDQVNLVIDEQKARDEAAVKAADERKKQERAARRLAQEARVEADRARARALREKGQEERKKVSGDLRSQLQAALSLE